jgi:hypothetical protein
MKIDTRPSIDDPERDRKIIIKQFMKELCRRDNEANRNMNFNTDANPNEFSIREIQEEVLGAFSLETVIDSLQHFEMDTDEPFIELGGQERRERVRLTNAGRAHCGVTVILGKMQFNLFETRFKCKICGKIFTTKPLLNKHYKDTSW